MSWASPVLLMTLRLSWLVHLSPQSPSWAPCRRVSRSKRRSPTEHIDAATRQVAATSDLIGQHTLLLRRKPIRFRTGMPIRVPTQKAMFMNFSLPDELLDATRLTKAGAREPRPFAPSQSGAIRATARIAAPATAAACADAQSGRA